MKKKQSKNTISSISIAVFVVAALFIVWLTGLSPFAEGKTAMMIIDFGNGHERAFSGPVMANMSVLDAMLASSRAGGFKLNYAVDADHNVTIRSLDDTINDSSDNSWLFYVNKRPVSSSDLDRVDVHSGDVLEAKFY